MIDTRTRYRGQGTPYEKRPAASPYYPKPPKPSLAETRSSLQRIVTTWTPILKNHKKLSDSLFLELFIKLKAEIKKHNSRHPNNAIIIKDVSGEPTLIYEDILKSRY